MFQLQTFMRQGHQKIIDHYSWLRDTASSQAERQRLQRRIEEELDALKGLNGQERGVVQRAA